MRRQESADRSARLGLPDDKHAVVASIGSHDPLLVVGAQNRCDLVAVTLQQLLLLSHVVVDHTRVSSRVENLSAFIIGQEVDTLVDVLVETVDLGERLDRQATQTANFGEQYRNNRQ